MKFIRTFKTEAEMNAFQPKFSCLLGNKENHKLKNFYQPNNEIWYTTDDEKILVLSSYYTKYSSCLECFGANIVSNTYENGKGVIKFDGNVLRYGGLDEKVFDVIPILESSDESRSLSDNPILTISLPESVTTIGGGAFFSCEKLESINIPSNLTKIGKSAFSGTNSLPYIKIPNGVTEIPLHCFDLCEKEYAETVVSRTIILGNNTTVIDDYAFSSDIYLSEEDFYYYITIPNTVTTIGTDEGRVFGEYTISKPCIITYLGTMEQWNNITFKSSYDRYGGKNENSIVHCIDGDIKRDE